MKKYTYISLFSSAGVGCYGFSQEGFNCIATSELLEKRLNIQKFNKKCKYESGYILGDISLPENHQRIFDEIELWKRKEKIKEVDVLVATPPCQGMSVANHKKNNEKNRNSLILESIKLIKDIRPRYFVFENVRAFLNTLCDDDTKKDIPIGVAIDMNLTGQYNILKKVVNFKDYGSNSSRTRTLVIGVKKDIKDVIPYDIFPKEEEERTLRQVIGKYKTLSNMGEISSDDIYHHFRRYNSKMVSWIKDVPEGGSAFDNKNPLNIPHRIIDGKTIFNVNKNGDKYSRCKWDKVAPCVHTRNDIISSQSTVHPVDNRVFSIRELMDMMTIPKEFKWTQQDDEELNNLSYEEKEKFLKKQSINIRQSIGESVPTIIFNKIAKNIISVENELISSKEIQEIISKNDLSYSYDKLYDFVINSIDKIPYVTISKIIEYSNLNRDNYSAFYTTKSICYSLVKNLPEFQKDTIYILEPSVGIGNFIPLLANKYKGKNIVIDVVDIDRNILKLLEIIYKKHFKNLKVNFINLDFLGDDINHKLKKQYDLVIGNPPFGKVVDKNLLKKYRESNFNSKTTNLFAFFLEKSLKYAKYVAMITPKSLLSAPEFNKTREYIEDNAELKVVVDYGEKGFDKVKIETISILLKRAKIQKKDYEVAIESYITDTYRYTNNTDLFDKDFNSWLIYKNDFFKQVKSKMCFSIFNFSRDRVITKRHTLPKGKVRVLKSRNLQSNNIINIKDYDCYIDNLSDLPVKKYLNAKAILIPNLSYNPRACFLPKDTIADGSIAILQPKDGYKVEEKDLEYYSTEEFREFYRIGRNLGTRSLNIDSNSIKLWGINRKKCRK